MQHPRRARKPRAERSSQSVHATVWLRRWQAAAAADAAAAESMAHLASAPSASTNLRERCEYAGPARSLLPWRVADSVRRAVLRVAPRAGVQRERQWRPAG